MSEIIQGAEAWFTIKRGKISASKINDVMSKLKSGKPGAGRKNYAARLVVERLTGTTEETFQSAAMAWGVEQEKYAREVYEFLCGVDVDQVAFVDHHHIEMAGMSPDGLIGDDGLLEIKCPNSSTHIDWMLAGVAPSEHIKQMQFQMACTGRNWCDFMSYDSRMPTDLQSFIVRVQRDNALIKEIETEVIILNREVSATIGRLLELASGEAA